MVTFSCKKLFLLSIIILFVAIVSPLQVQASDYGSQMLSIGSQGSFVGQLQTDLSSLGFNTYGTDGIFGSNTVNAVVAFQQAQGLTTDGIVGSNTKDGLNKVLAAKTPDQNLKLGSQGSAVLQLQNNLTALGFSTYGVDGTFGANTYNAVVRFQRAKGLRADGVVGSNTQATITAALKVPSSGGNPTDTQKYPRLSKVNGIFGQFRYRELSGGSIEVDPNWIDQNIITITLPGLNRSVQVNQKAAPYFIRAFTYIKDGTAMVNGKQVPLLSLINTMDGTWVTRHINWNPANGLSNHSWGTAIDINAANHFKYVMPAQELNDPNLILWKQAFQPAGFSWGNSYSDSMHYEILK